MKIRKLLLKLDDLRVESFATQGVATAEPGTVCAEERTRNCTRKCDTVAECPATAQPTCGIQPVTIDLECALLAADTNQNCEPTIDIACCL